MAAACEKLHVSLVSLQNDCKWGLGASDVRADVLASDFAKTADDSNLMTFVANERCFRCTGDEFAPL